jgi:putative oxidoreductase
MQENFQDAEIGVAQFCPLDAPGRVGDQRLEGFHENEPDMNAGGVLPCGRSFPLHSDITLTQNVLMSIYCISNKLVNMKIITVIVRFLLGLIFLVFGLNGFLHFIPSSPPSGTAGQFVGALFVSHYLVPIFLLQIISAVLLLVNRYVPLALTLLAPIIVNILLIHILMLPSGLPLALVVTVLWIVVFLSVRSAFTGLFQQRVAT